MERLWTVVFSLLVTGVVTGAHILGSLAGVTPHSFFIFFGGWSALVTFIIVLAFFEITRWLAGKCFSR